MPICPFCPKNELVQIIRDNEVAYLVAALDESRSNKMPGRYLIIPKDHHESVLDLPVMWHQSLVELLPFIPEFRAGVPFNINYNEGRAAGQRVDHAHAWIIFRQGEEGSMTENLGLSALIEQGRSTKK